MKIAVVCDNRLRRDTTGMYFLWGFERLGYEVEHLLPPDALNLKKPLHDLYLKVDDGLKEHWEWNEKIRPAMYYCIDTHYWDAAEWRPRVASQFDWVFTAQKNGVEFFSNNGVSDKVSWLPLGADEDLHSPTKEHKKSYHWGFVGNVGHADPGKPNKRLEYLDMLLKKFPEGVISDYSFYKEMADLYGRSRLVFNTCINNDINMRFWEGMMSGSCLVTETVHQNGQEELDSFSDGPPLVYLEYSNRRKLVNVFKSALAFPEQTEETGRKARQAVLLGHTYSHRCQDILQKSKEI